MRNFQKAVANSSFMCYGILGVLSSFGGYAGRGYGNLYFIGGNHEKSI